MNTDRIDVVVCDEGSFEDGFFVQWTDAPGGTPSVAIGDYSRTYKQESSNRLRLMSPAVARRLAREIATMADIVERAMPLPGEGDPR